MSAVLAPFETVEPTTTRATRPALRAVPTEQLRLSTLPFVMLLATLVGLGMVGLLLLNVHIQDRARDVQALQATAQQRGYEQAALTSQVQRLRSSTDLQQRAWALGLRPNPNPAFLVLPTGTVLGEPTRVTGSEMPNQKYRSADQVTEAIDKANKAAIARKEAARKQAELDRRAAIAKREAAAKLAADKAKAAQAAKQKADAAKAAQAQKQKVDKSTPTTTAPAGKPTGTGTSGGN